MAYSLLCITHEGLEELAMEEVAELYPAAKLKAVGRGAFTAEVPDDEGIAMVCYGSRILEKVLLELSVFDRTGGEMETSSILTRLADASNIEPWLLGRTFKADCFHRTDGEVSPELPGATGAEILRILPDAKVNLEKPDVVAVLVMLGERWSLAIDLCGFDLSKRDYRIFDHARAVKGTVGAAAVRLALQTPGGILLDPLGGPGVLIIEGALATSGKPVHFFQKDLFSFPNLFDPTIVNATMKTIEQKKTNPRPCHFMDSSHRFVSSTKKNAKIAAVDKLITCSRNELGWLDIKYDPLSVGAVVTQIPHTGRSNSRGEVESLTSELFYQSSYILDKQGIVVLIIPDPTLSLSSARKHAFSLAREFAFFQGQMPLYLQVWHPPEKRDISRHQEEPIP